MLFDALKSQCATNQKIVVCEENGRQHITNNSKGDYEVYKYKIDGGIITNAQQGSRCDYIVEANKGDINNAFIIELKGSDVEQAIEQIKATINRYRSELRSYYIRPRIVYRNNVHDIKGSKMRQFKKDYPLTVYKTNCLEDDLSKLSYK